MSSTTLFSAAGEIQDSNLYDEVFGLLEAARNYSRDCAPSAEFEDSFLMQIEAHLPAYSSTCIAWFDAQVVTAPSV